MVGELHQCFLGLGAVEFAVEAHALLRRVDVVSGETHLHIGLDGAVRDVGFLLFLVENILKFSLFQFENGLVEDFVVGLKTDVVDETALFCAENVARTANVEVAHGDVDAFAEVGKFLQGTKAFLGFLGEGVQWRRQ